MQGALFCADWWGAAGEKAGFPGHFLALLPSLCI